ncbi:MAG: restriction endonuclease subunit S [Allomuricauda sp.]
MNKKKKLIPEIRFPEFLYKGKWEIKTVEEICDVFRGSTFSKSDINEDGIELCIHYGELFTKYKEVITKIYSRTNEQNGFRSEIGDVLMPSSDVTPDGLARASAIMINDVVLGGDMNILRPKTEINSIFLSYLLNHSKREIIKLVSGTTVKHIYASQIMTCELLIPKDELEQQEIADCLSSLDDLITGHTNKLETLIDHKKGLLQNLFPKKGQKVPDYRFPEFENDGDWEEKSLGKVAEFSKGKGISKSDIVENGKLPCIRYGELYTHYKETIENIKSSTNLDASDLVLSEINDVIIPASGETQIDIATASCVLKEGVALGGDLNIIKTEINGVFLAYYLNNAKKKAIAQIAQGVSVVHLYSSQLKTLRVNIPKPKEQQKVASCLSAVDELIGSQEKKIEQLQQHKKGLMQGLFPKIEN